MTTLFHLAGLPVTAYALGMAGSVLISAIVLWHGFSRNGLQKPVAERLLLIALPLCLLLGRLFYVLIRAPFFLSRGDGLAYRLYQGGTTVWGALAGLLLAALLVSRWEGIRPKKLLDAIAPAALLMLALGRFCEGLAGQGFGEEASQALSFFPFAVGNEWGEWRWAIFMVEGAAALVFLLLILRVKTPGSRVALALALLCASQILFESLREDEFLRWGFVRAGQVMAALFLFAQLLHGLYASARWSAPRHLAVAAFALLLLVVAAVEYALDKTGISTLLLYGLMSLAVLGLFALVRRASPIYQEETT